MNGELCNGAVNIPKNGLLLSKLQNDGPLTLMFLGGSITAGFDGEKYLDEPYPELLRKYLVEKYPTREIKCVNLSVPAYMSAMGLFEYAAHAEDIRPDIVFIEFAVNDNFDRFNAENYESLVRRIIGSDWHPAAVSVNCCRSDGTTCEAYMREIADYYGLPSVSLKAALETSENADIYTNDGIHLHKGGHELIFMLTKSIFENAYNGRYCEIHDECCYGNSLEKIGFYDSRNLDITSYGDFLPCEIGKFEGGLSHRHGKEPLKFTFSGDMHYGVLSIVYIINSDPKLYGSADIIINGKICTVLDGYSIYGWDNPVCFGAVFEKSSEISVEIRMHRGDEDKRFDIVGFGI